MSIASLRLHSRFVSLGDCTTRCAHSVEAVNGQRWSATSPALLTMPNTNDATVTTVTTPCMCGPLHSLSTAASSHLALRCCAFQKVTVFKTDCVSTKTANARKLELVNHSSHTHETIAIL